MIYGVHHSQLTFIQIGNSTYPKIPLSRQNTTHKNLRGLVLIWEQDKATRNCHTLSGRLGTCLLCLDGDGDGCGPGSWENALQVKLADSMVRHRALWSLSLFILTMWTPLCCCFHSNKGMGNSMLGQGTSWYLQSKVFVSYVSLCQRKWILQVLFTICPLLYLFLTQS